MRNKKKKIEQKTIPPVSYQKVKEWIDATTREQKRHKLLLLNRREETLGLHTKDRQDSPNITRSIDEFPGDHTSILDAEEESVNTQQYSMHVVSWI